MPDDLVRQGIEGAAYVGGTTGVIDYDVQEDEDDED